MSGFRVIPLPLYSLLSPSIGLVEGRRQKTEGRRQKGKDKQEKAGGKRITK
jgi:hypothetical protein